LTIDNNGFIKMKHLLFTEVQAHLTEQIKSRTLQCDHREVTMNGPMYTPYVSLEKIEYFMKRNRL